MKTVIIVSKCLRVTKFSDSESWYEFHFRGVCAGEVIKRIVLLGNRELGITKGEEYLLYVRLMSFEVGTFKGIIVKARSLDECWDRS